MNKRTRATAAVPKPVTSQGRSLALCRACMSIPPGSAVGAWPRALMVDVSVEASGGRSREVVVRRACRSPASERAARSCAPSLPPLRSSRSFMTISLPREDARFLSA